MAGTLVKNVQLDIEVKGDATAKAQLDAITARADTLKKAFPTYTVKIDRAAATLQLGALRAQMQAAADAVKKPLVPQVLTANALKSLAAIAAEAEKLKKNFPQFQASIDDTAYKAKLAVMAADAKATADQINRSLSSVVSRATSGGIGGRIGSFFGGGAGGIGSGAGGAAASGGSAASSGLPGALSNPYVAAGAAAGAAAALPFAAQAISTTIVAGLGAALAGLGIAGALKSQQPASLTTATTNYQGASAALNTAISTSPADMAAYQATLGAVAATTKTAGASTLQLVSAQDALKAAQDRVSAAQARLTALQGSGKATAAQLASAHAVLAAAQGSVASAQDRLNKLQAGPAKAALQALEPDLASAAKLLTDQSIQWQNLTPAQQASLTALRNNSAAYKILLPDQKNALNAILKERDAWNALSPAQQSAARASAGMQTALSTLQGDASDALTALGASFVPVLTSIFNTADSILNKMTPVFVSAEKAIAGPFQGFADALITAFGGPAVQQSVKAVAAAFGAILKAVTPTLAGDVNDIAIGITNVANAVAKNPNAVADFVSDMFKVAGAALDIISSLTRVANWIELHWDVIKWIAVPVVAAVQEVVAHWGTLSKDTQATLGNLGNWIYNDFIAKIIGWFDSTLPNSLIRAVNSIRNDFVNPFTTAFNNLQNWIYNDFILKVARFFDVNLPGAFAAGERAISAAWGHIQNDVAAPVRWVVNNILNPLFGFIDDVTNFVGLGRPLPGVHLAAGGMVTGGTPGRDSVVAALMPGEVVVPASMVAGGAVDHLRGRLPGFAGGGFVNPIGLNLTPERIDMGVDYGGNGPLFALGSGVITSLYNTGWPGGGFIGLHLDAIPGGGVPWWYYAEDVAPFKIGVGSRVTAGQYIAQATGGPSGIEVGFAAPPGTGNTMAAATGESNAGQSRGDAGLFSTGWGVAASNLIASLGGRPGILSAGGVQGATPGIAGGFAGIIKTVEQIFSGLGNAAKVAIDLAHGDTGGAARALLGLIPHSAGGASGAFAQMLLGLPVTMAADAMRFMLKGVQSFAVANATTGGGGGGIGPVSGPADAGPGQAQDYARSRLGAFGWDVAQFLPLQALWNRESGWNRFALNPSSGAYGIAQALPASKYPLAGQVGGGSHASAQIDWGLGYIAGRYGSPAGAWGHEVAFNWYDSGGILKPGLTLAYNSTGRAEQVIPAGGAGAVIHLDVHGGQSEFDQFMLTWMRRHVKVRGGGSVQRAFGTH